MITFWRRHSTDTAEGSDGARETKSDADVASTVSVHPTSQGLVRYRRWPNGRMSIEVLDEPATLLARVSTR